MKPGTPARWEKWFSPGRFAALSAVLITGCFPEVIFGGHSFFYRDFGCFGLPNAAYHRDSFFSGELPLWNPYSYCGLPFAAQWNCMVFYPGTLVYLLLPFPWSLNFFCLLHLFLGCTGMYRLALSFTDNQVAASAAGIAYGFNGLMLHSLMWPNNIAGLGLAPWVISAWIKAAQHGGSWTARAALITALQLLTGAPEVILFSWIVAAVLGWDSCFRKAVSRQLGVAALSLGLAAIQLFPFVALLRHSQRDASFDQGSWAMPVHGLVNFVAPLFGCTPSMMGVYTQDEQQWTSSYYLGIGVLLFSIASQFWVRDHRMRALAIISSLAIWMAMGKQGGLHSLFQQVVPWAGFVRFPVKFLILPVLCLPLCAAFGIKSASTRPPKVILMVSCLLGIVLLGILFHAVLLPESATAAALVNSRSAASRLFVLVLISACTLCLRQGSSLGAKISSLLLPILLFADGITHTPRQNPTVQARVFETPSAVNLHKRAMISPTMQSFLNNAGTPVAADYCSGARSALFANYNLLQRVPKVNGFFSLITKEQGLIEKAIYSSGQFTLENLMDFLGVERVSSDEKLFGWKERSSALPLVSGGQKPVFLEAANTLEAVLSPTFAPRKQVYLPPEAQQALSNIRPANVTVDSLQVSPHRMSFVAEADAPAIVSIAQTFYHGWKAKVNGKAVPLWKSNFAFQAVAIPQGRSQVVLAYQDNTFRFGVIFSAFSLGVCALLLVRKRPNEVL